jgi:hypothetical protein
LTPAARRLRAALGFSSSRHARRRDIWGWLGILAGAAVFVAALAVPFGDAGLAIAVALVLRGGLTVLDADGASR